MESNAVIAGSLAFVDVSSHSPIRIELRAIARSFARHPPGLPSSSKFSNGRYFRASVEVCRPVRMAVMLE
jgi:hypothetical protein